MGSNKVPKSELVSRMERFTKLMDSVYDSWELCAVVGGMNMFYLTGSINDGLLLIKRSGSATYWVRRSYERALLESEFDDIRPMRSFRDISGAYGYLPDTLYLDTANATLDWYNLLCKYMPFSDAIGVDKLLMGVRAVKSEYELGLLRDAGAAIELIYREDLPVLLRDGISEADLGAELYSLFMKRGSHGATRFSMRNTDAILGHVAFGESPLYPSAFNGASGVNGLCPAVPALGNRDRFLREGDLIYVDLSFAVNGYHIDKTVVLSYKTPQSESVLAAHRHCLELDRIAVSMLKPGVRPSDIYERVLAAVDSDYRDCFMGVAGRTVPFIGHGVGLHIDELPVIAKGFDAPLELNMTIALEPKIGIDGVGMVGSENTYLVTADGGVSITGELRDVDVVG